MKYVYVALVAAAVLSARISIFRHRRQRRVAHEPTGDAVGEGRQLPAASSQPARSVGRKQTSNGSNRLGDVGIIAGREIRQRVRGRIFRVGTLFVLLAVAAAIIIPTLHRSSGGLTGQTVGVVGRLSPELKQVVEAAASGNEDSVRFVPEPSLGAARADLRSDKVDLAIIDGDEVLLEEPAQSKSSPADPSFVQDTAQYIGVLRAYRSAGLSPTKAIRVFFAKSVPVRTLHTSSKSATRSTSVIGIVLLFLMLTQYLTWTLIGVMQEKSSRVVEVLLAAVRPIQLLGGKVLGIGAVALGQAALIVGFALALSAAVGSNLLHGAGPLTLLSELLWFVLGYAFYCWVYAAAGSMAERQDQVQTLALPLSIPILVGYVFSITVASAGNPDLFFKVLAYLPPTAPFCMSVLVGLGQVAWWQFLASVLISIAGTIGMASFAARIYRRAVLRTGGRVRAREILRLSARPA